MIFDHHFLQKVVSGVTIASGNLPEDPRFSIDSRTMNQGDIFVALEGKQVDGHDFVDAALKKGASGFIIAQSRKELVPVIKASAQEAFIALVPDTYQALITLAHEWRMAHDLALVGITGSIGKTSTKEMLASILEEAHIPFIASYANQNTELGLALNLLRIRDCHKAAIFELGISKRGEMARLAQLAQPTIGVITYIGNSHVAGLGDVASEKRALFSKFKADNIGIINGDQPIVSAISYPHPVVKFGCKTTNQIQARKIVTNNVSTNFILKIYGERLPITLASNHTGRVNNALAASAAAQVMNIPHSAIVAGLEKATPVSGRFVQKKAHVIPATLIDDAYNASPESMRAALIAFEKVDAKEHKVAVLGDMLELGVNSPFWHRQLGRFLRKTPSLTHVVLVGTQMAWAKKTAPLGLTVEHVATWTEALEVIKSRYALTESVVLVKGSFGTGLHKLVANLTETTP